MDLKLKDEEMTMKSAAEDSTVIKQTFSMLRRDRELIEELRLRAWKAGVLLNRSEVVRAAIYALATLDKTTFASFSSDVPKLKPGRPTDIPAAAQGDVFQNNVT
jgi:hypothetical protein